MSTVSDYLHAKNPRLGSLLREWRAVRRVSQLDLALASEVSPKHLSFVETGKSVPSRQLLDRLAEQLQMPLRQRNLLHLAAGYAPPFRETDLSAPQMSVVRQAVEATLKQQEPFPAFAMDRHWNVIIANRGMLTMLHFLKKGGPKHGNIFHQIFDPDDMRPFIANWTEVSQSLLRHLHHEVMRAPGDREAQKLLKEVLAYPDVPASWASPETGQRPIPVLTTRFQTSDVALEFLSTVTHFGTNWDLTVDEIRLECMHPVDERTRTWCANQQF